MNNKKRQWPPTLAYVQRLQRKADELDRRVSQDLQQPFVEQFVKNLGVIAAHTPYEDWPDIFKMCASNAAAKCPASWHEYKSHLPKK